LPEGKVILQDLLMIKILAVEDNKAIVDFYFEFFTDFGYEVQTAEDAGTAIQKQQSFHADIMILDLDIPGGGGIYVYDTVRNKMKDNVPIIFSTGKPEKLAELRGLSNVSSLGKPTPPEKLIAEVQRLAGTKKMPQADPGFAPPPPPPGPKK